MTNDHQELYNSSKYAKWLKAVFLLILVYGLGLRFYQYFMGRSLWEDETHLALNFLKYGYLRLMEPLDWIQGAPIFFILTVKTFVKTFGYGELAFRAFPFLVSILSFPLFYYIVFELTKSKVTALLAFFIFAINIALIYFSSELKQYAVDVSVYLVMSYIALSQHAYIFKHRKLLLAIGGCVAIVFSNVGFIILFAIACHILLNWYQAKKWDKREFVVLLCWAFVFLVNYILFIHDHPSTHEQRTNYAFAFCPTDVLSCEFSSFLKKTIEETCFTLLLYVSKEHHFSYVLFFIFLVAIVNLLKNKKYDIILFTCVPIALHLLLSALKLYPFWYRLILYLVPCFITLMAIGTMVIADFIRRKIHVSLAVLVVFVFSYFFAKPSVEQYPLWQREIKPNLNFIQDSLPQTAHIYIMDPINAYRYYYKTNYLKKDIYRGLPWEIDPPEFNEMVGSERSNYILMYGTTYQWGYADILEDLRKRNLVVKTFEYKGYGVMLVKPLTTDSLISVKDVDYTLFGADKNFNDNNMLANWGGELKSQPFPLRAGKYRLSIVSKGTPAEGVYPHTIISLNGNKIGDYFDKQYYSTQFFSFEIPKDTSVSLTINMDNDFSVNGEDRNSFIWSCNIYK